MKLIFRQLEKDSSGTLKLVLTEREDMWHVYNLIAKGDEITADTVRKVKSESSTGSVDSKKVRTTVTVMVKEVDFDTESCSMRVSGTNVAENKFIKLGAHHTIDIELNKPLTLKKDEWDFMTLERIDVACSPSKNAEVAAVVMQEGLAHVCLVTASMTLVLCKIEKRVPRKGKGLGSQHDKAVAKFFNQIMEAIERHVNFDVVKCMLVGSPGYLKDQFLDHMAREAVRTGNKVFLDNKSKFVGVHASSGYKHALSEILADAAVISLLKDTKASAEIIALDAFYAMLRDGPERAFYGFNHVYQANESQAIDTLLITDKLFRASSVETRKKYVALVESAQANGASVHVFSSLHVSGEKLGQLSGIAAILRFPMSEILATDDTEDEDSSDDEGVSDSQHILRRS